MKVLMSLYLAALFVAFVPGVLVTLPKGGKRMTVVAVHALLFTLVWYLTHKFVSRLSEGFQMDMDMEEEEEGFRRMTVENFRRMNVEDFQNLKEGEEGFTSHKGKK